MDKDSRLVIMGDVCPTADYAELFANGNHSALLGDIYDDIQHADYVICNLECALAKTASKAKKCGPCLTAKVDDIRMLRGIGIRAVSLANNHIKDYGAEGVLNMMDALDENEVSWFGAGKDKNSIIDFHCISVGEKKIGFISFAEEEFNIASEKEPGAIMFDPYFSLPLVARYKERCDFLVVLYHGGIEHYIYPSTLLQKKCRSLIDAGANLVLCQHSHCIGTVEHYKDCVILYGQGNSIFGYREGDERWNEGLLVELLIQNGAVDIRYRLIKASPNGIRYADRNSEQKKMKEIEDRTQKLNDVDFVNKEWRDFCDKNAALNRALLFGKGRFFNFINRKFKNYLFKMCTSKEKEMITMNLIRCDSWREVVTTILEGDVYGK